ncbi:thiol-disulfide isomerase/thioredoxin [Pedobacter africanus]|uniref:Thiol-disulfide isomerase/thioredoxin n=1 Tax=Pedobacter africanus TaxID=151894 RepID=A0ACC6KU86_9SPHI|nr:redoxin domain-containing protein [Pedobacter africanus]MDR6782707.1 thiol-disulfide isomerase/thioredoxin [Pedobacter africanus]
MKIKLIYLAAIVVASLQSFGQNSLKIGQQLPDIEISKIFYHKTEKAKLSDFKGKLIILDFWSTACSSCIAGMPKMDTLQKHFGDKIAILPVYVYINGKMDQTLVTYLDSYWRSSSILSKTSLPSILDDNFAKHFPVRVAYQVWIDEYRIIRAITSPEYVNKKEIQKMLNGIFPEWEIELKAFYDGKSPLFQQTNSTDAIFHSEFSSYRRGLDSSFGIIEESRLKRQKLFIANSPIISIYQQGVFDSNGKITNDNIVIETSDSSRYFPNTYLNEWLAKNSYCYEAYFPISENKTNVQKKMLTDLNKRLGVNARFEKREVDCWILKQKKVANTSNPLTKGTAYKNIEELVSYIKSTIYDKNTKRTYRSLPILNESGLKDKINVKIDRTANLNIANIIKQLNQQGFDLVKEKRLREVFVITDKSELKGK